jgi:two-component system, OmpR family, alkaline phosphatase synthesis response regulator PhoP
VRRPLLTPDPRVIRRRILLVEDEPGLVMTLTDRLTAEGYDVESVTEAPGAAEKASSGAYDAIVLDVMLPGGNGFDICRAIRQRGVATPVLMLTARGQVVDRVVGLKLGADDYLIKPFEMAELLARIEALLRRGGPVTQGLEGSFRFGDVAVDFRRAEVTRQGEALDLSAQEFKLLRYFIEHRGATLSRDELLNEVWGYNAMPSTRTVDVHVAWLRQKIEETPRHPRHILTVHGMGYKFVT